MPNLRDIEGLNYTNALRAVGRFLDSEQAFHATILEVDDGLNIRFQSSVHQADGRSRFFAWDRIRDLMIYNTAGRGLRGRRPRSLGMWPSLERGRQDLYRALGTKLDDEQATGVTIDERSGEVSMSYMRPLPANRLGSEKHTLAITEAEFEELIEWAQTKRVSGLAEAATEESLQQFGARNQ